MGYGNEVCQVDMVGSRSEVLCGHSCRRRVLLEGVELGNCSMG